MVLGAEVCGSRRFNEIAGGLAAVVHGGSGRRRQRTGLQLRSGDYLHAAIDLAQPIEVVRTLLDLDADPNLEGIGRASPMWAAIPYGRCSSYGLDVLDELVNAGGDRRHRRDRQQHRRKLPDVLVVSCDKEQLDPSRQRLGAAKPPRRAAPKATPCGSVRGLRVSAARCRMCTGADVAGRQTSES